MRISRSFPLIPAKAGIQRLENWVPALAGTSGKRRIGDQMLSALDIVRRIEAGALSPRGALEQCVATIEAREKDIGAFVALVPAAARSHGEGAQRAKPPLAGLPVAFKDIFATADLPTQYGSPILSVDAPTRADPDATLTTRPVHHRR